MAGRNLAVLVEAAARNFVLQQRGINTMQEFINRHDQHLQEQ
jgi:HPr kinase/phosphorylase